MHSSCKIRGSLLVFLLVILAVATAVSGCAGTVSSSPAPSSPAAPAAAQLSVTPSSVSVNAAIGVVGSQVVTASNTGKANLSVSQVQISGTGFSLTGLTAPLSLTPGQSQSFTVTFDATASGTVSGMLTFTTNASPSAVVIPLQGTAAAAASPVTSVSISPNAPSAIVSSTIPFSATVQGTTSNTATTWKAAKGTITAAGVYTAPSATGTDTVSATSVADSTKSASTTVTVIAAPASPVVTSIAISPASTSVLTGATAQFTASVQGTVIDKSVTWKASAGTITSVGLYAAASSAGTATITATSNADKTKSSTATITVNAPPVVNGVTVSPSPVSALTGATVQFTASVAGTVTDKSVAWKATAGNITSAGVFTAPTTAGTVTVTATSNADTTKSASSTVTVAAPVVTSVAVSPATAAVQTGGSAIFSATVNGTVSNKSVAWKAKLGAITSSGAYTAPATAGTDTVTATSAADATKSASATVTVAAPVVNSVTVTPTTSSVITGGTATFSATVNGNVSNKFVTWKAKLGTITAGGAYTAPAGAGTDTVTATSAADATKSATATVSVTAPTVTSVTISPSSTSATTGGTLTFQATVNGTVADKSVTWKASLGTITAGGVYTAPSKAGTDAVTATSDADSTKSASASVAVSTPPVSAGTVAAFPGAQGGGATAVGGRGGKVMEVTTLGDSGAGSLRACIEASGARNCVFRVAGIISPQSQLKVENPFLTIACQTAPGVIIIGGPKIAGDALFITTHDVIVRYCTFSADNINVAAGPDTGTMNIEIANNDNYNIIFDHITTRWAGNKLWLALSNYVGPNHGITTQWSMFYEPHAAHPVGPGTGTNPGCAATSSSPCFSASEKDIDFHHNMFANMSHRIPESTNYSTRWTNNIVYNWQYYASEWLGAMHVDEIGNKYVAGNLNPAAQPHEIHFTTNSPPLPGNPSVYLSGNIGPSQSDPSGNQYVMAAQISGENGNEEGSIPTSWIRSSPMAGTSIPIVADSANNLDGILLPTVGNSQHLDCNGGWVSHRDSADSRIINQYKTKGSGGFWPNGITDAGATSIPTPSSSWTDQPVTNFSACTESQHDGIPDAWKIGQGLSTTDPNLHSTTAPNGYTWLENYVNGPAGAAGSTSLFKPGPAGQMWAATRPASSSDPGSRAPAHDATFALASGNRGR
jgi:uncharacterized protein YjdB